MARNVFVLRVETLAGTAENDLSVLLYRDLEGVEEGRSRLLRLL